MINAIEVIMFEHQSIRKTSQFFEKGGSFNLFVDFNNYLAECHIRIEEEIIFPILKGAELSDSYAFRPLLDRVLSDHKLIETLAANLVKWNDSGNDFLIAERMPLYWRVLLEHNMLENSSIFPIWHEVSGLIDADSLKRARNIIHSFGRDRYLKVTGMSQKEFQKTFG